MPRRKSKKVLLFEKRSKNFCYHRRVLPQRARIKAKVFWFFFSKKNALLFPKRRASAAARWHQI
jgi:hypothetical protein